MGVPPMAMETSIWSIWDMSGILVDYPLVVKSGQRIPENSMVLDCKIIELGDLPYVSLLAGSSEVVSAGSHETMFFPSDTCILSVGVIFPIFVTSVFFLF